MICPACGTSYQPGTQHCPSCGMRLDGSSVPIPVAAVGPAAQATAPTPSAASAILPAGTVLNGRYRVERVLGAGAFGRVYLVTDTQDSGSPPLAVKELLDRPFASPDEQRETIAWFKREVSTLLTLEYPGIPTIYGYWTAHTTSGPLYLVMDYIPGKTMEQALGDAGGRIPWPQVATWGVALCDVLGYLHSRVPPVVFRDIKLSNVMLDSRTNRPVLIDFGIARQLAQAGGTTIGTPGYAPYEQWLGRAEPRSDLYALGALLHTLLTGLHPEAEYTRLRNSQGYDVERAIRALYPPVHTLVPGVPLALSQALLRATAFDVTARFPDAAAMATALRQALAAPAQSLPTMHAPPVNPTAQSLATPPVTPAAGPAPPPTPLPGTAGAVGSSAPYGNPGKRGIQPMALAFMCIGIVVVGSAGGLFIARQAFGPSGRRVAVRVATPTPQPSPLRATPTVSAATATPMATSTPMATPTPMATSAPVIIGVPTPSPSATPTATPRPRPTPRSSAAARKWHAHRSNSAFYISALQQGLMGAELRTGPNGMAPGILLIPHGARVSMSGSATSRPQFGHWYRVTYRAKHGYVRGALLSKQRPASPTPLYVNAAPYVYTGVYIRARPKLTAAILGGIDNGARIRAIARPVPGASGGAWDLVVFQHKIGYVRAELLSAHPPAPTATMYVDGGATYPDGVYVREHPSLTAAVIIGIANGTPVQAVGNPVPGDNGEEWYIVEYQNHIGYARANLLDPAS